MLALVVDEPQFAALIVAHQPVVPHAIAVTVRLRIVRQAEEREGHRLWDVRPDLMRLREAGVVRRQPLREPRPLRASHAIQPLGCVHPGATHAASLSRTRWT